MEDHQEGIGVTLGILSARSPPPPGSCRSAPASGQEARRVARPEPQRHPYALETASGPASSISATTASNTALSLSPPTWRGRVARTYRWHGKASRSTLVPRRSVPPSGNRRRREYGRDGARSPDVRRERPPAPYWSALRPGRAAGFATRKGWASARLPGAWRPAGLQAIGRAVPLIRGPSNLPFSFWGAVAIGAGPSCLATHPA